MTAAPEPLTISAESPLTAEALALLTAHKREILHRYDDDGENDPDQLDPNELTGAGYAFLIARRGAGAVGCGAFRPFAPGIAELKRLYVVPAARGQGIGRALVRALEAAARAAGYRAVCLETGLRQPEAIALYESLGYRPMAPYGPYADSPLTACFEKLLD